MIKKRKTPLLSLNENLPKIKNYKLFFNARFATN